MLEQYTNPVDGGIISGLGSATRHMDKAADEITAVLGNLVYTPDDAQSTADCSAIPENLTPQKMLDQNKRVVIYGETGNLACDKVSPSLKNLMFARGLGEISKKHEDRTILSSLKGGGNNFTENEAANEFTNGTNLLTLDKFTTAENEDFRGAVWTWRAGEPNNAGGGEHCAAQWNDPGPGVGHLWRDATCTNFYHFACQDNVSGAWHVTTATGPWSQGQAECQNISPTHYFNTPVNAEDNRRITDLKPSEAIVWLNATTQGTGGSWVIKHRFNNYHTMLQNRQQTSQVIHIENGSIESGPNSAGSHSALWTLEPVFGTSFVRLRNRWQQDQYIHIEHGSIESSAIAHGAHSSHWFKEPVGNTSYFRLQNRGQPDQYIHIENGQIEAGPVEPDWLSAQWLEMKVYPIEWTEISGCARYIGASRAADAWRIGCENPGFDYGRLYRWTGSDWQLEQSGTTEVVSIKSVTVDSNGIPYVVNKLGNIYRGNDPQGNSWTQLPGCAQDIGIGPAYGRVWHVGCDDLPGGGSLYRWSAGNFWVQVPGQATKIAIGGNGTPWHVNKLGKIYRGDDVNGSSWTQTPGCAQDIGVGPGGEAWIVGCEDLPGGSQIYRWSGSEWQQIPGEATAIDIGHHGTPWHVNKLGKIYRGTVEANL